MAKRTKKTVVSGINRDEAERAFAEFAKADAEVQSINAKMDVELLKIREKYADKLAELGETKEKNFYIVQAYATENKEELFIRRKSIECVHGTYGFRTGTPKLKLLKGFTWEAVLKLCEEFLPAYVRVKAEVAKDKLLSDRESEEVSGMFCKVGITVAQDETFYLEPKKEEAE